MVMVKDTLDIRGKYLNLIENILEVYRLAKKARFEATDDRYYAALGEICHDCAKMIAVVERTL